MHALPATIIQMLAPFTPLFSERVWRHVQVLVAGTILAPGKRTVSSALRAMGLEKERRDFTATIVCSAAHLARAEK